MSVGSIASNTWTPPLPPQPVPGSACNPFSTASGAATSMTMGSSPASGSTDPFQQLASDIQAMLLQAQGGTAAPAATSVGSATTAANAAGGSTVANPEQQVASDAQAMLAKLQSGQTGSGSTSQTATASQTGASEAQPHHHHHHHEGGGSQPGGDAGAMTAGTSSAGTTGSSTATASGSPNSGSGSTTTSASLGDQAVSQAFASDIMQALQAYGGTPSGVASPGLTA